MLSICYVDDDPKDRKRFAERLSGGNTVVQPVSPPEQLSIEPIIRTKPDVLLIDYELTKPETGRSPVSYQGGTLASRIRESFPDHPVVLLTREGLLAKREYRQMRDFMQIFDDVVYKGNIEKEPGAARSLLTSLAEGFARLRGTKPKSWKSLLRLLEAPPEAEDSLRKAGAPLRSEAHSPTANWRVQEAARWIRGVVLAYPGILYDRLHTATALGIAIQSFSMPSVRKLFAPAEYRGPFQPQEGRWWRVRIYDIAQRVITAAKFSGSANVVFAAAYGKRARTRLKPARCIFSNAVPADWVCYVLQKPVKRQYSLPYHPDDRPAVMDEARVSFKAIRQDNRVLDELFDEQGQELLKEIRNLKQ